MASQPVTSAAEMTAGADRYERFASGGPMQMASSASCTASDVRSASLYATTASMPSSWQARRMRRAISPRFAIRTFRNTGAPSAARAVRRRGGRREFDDEQLLTVLDGVAGLGQARAEEAVDRRDHLLGDPQHVDRAETIAGADLRAGGEIGPRPVDADGRRGRHAARLGAGAHP